MERQISDSLNPQSARKPSLYQSARNNRTQSGSRRRASQIRPSQVIISPSPSQTLSPKPAKSSSKKPLKTKKNRSANKYATSPKSRKKGKSKKNKGSGRSANKGKGSSRNLVGNSSRTTKNVKGNSNRANKTTKRNRKLSRASKLKRGSIGIHGNRRSSQTRVTDCCADGKYCAKGGKMMYKPGRFGFTYDGNTITDVTRGLQSDDFGVRVGWKIISINNEDQPNNSKAIANALANAKKIKKPIAIVFSTEGLKPNIGGFNLFDNSFETDAMKTKNSRQRCCMPLNNSTIRKNAIRPQFKSLRSLPRFSRSSIVSLKDKEISNITEKLNISGDFLLVWHDGEMFNSKYFMSEKEGNTHISSLPSLYSYAFYQTNNNKCITNQLGSNWKDNQKNFREKFEESVRNKQQNVNDFLASKA